MLLCGEHHEETFRARRPRPTGDLIFRLDYTTTVSADGYTFVAELQDQPVFVGLIT
jgi:hypothetical protein